MAGFLKDDEGTDIQPSEAGWLECPEPPKDLPADPKAKVMAVTAYLEACGVSLAVVAKQHPKWFYTQFVRPLLPRETNVNLTAEVLTDDQLEARIRHLASVLGPGALQKYIEGAPKAIDITPLPAEMEDMLS